MTTCLGADFSQIDDASMISVIIPARNAAGTIDRTLASLAGERDLLSEVLLIDDGSGDDTARIALAAARKRDLPLTVKAGRFGSAGAARNAGIGEAKGRYVYFIDADDEMVPGGLRLLYDALVGNPEAGIAIGASIRRAAGRPDKLKVPAGYCSDCRSNARGYLRNEMLPIAMGSALIVNDGASAIRFPVSINLDEDTWYWAAMLCRKAVEFIPNPVLHYNHDEDRMTERFVSLPRRYMVAVSAELNRLEAHGIDKATLQWRKAWLAMRVARLLIKEGSLSEAADILRISIAHPEFRGAWRIVKYRSLIAIGRVARSLGVGTAGRRDRSPE